MLDKRIPGAANKQVGFTLIELMIAVVLGLLITAAVTAMTVNSLKISGDTLKSARLNQDLDAVMQIMVNDIRRAGYSYCDKANNHCYDTNCESCTGGLCTNPPETSNVCYGTNVTPEDVSINDAGNCILYHYNKDNDGDITDENYGFRRVVVSGVGILQMADNTGTVACNADDNWVRLTDPEIINVTEFSLNTENSKCHNVDEGMSIRIQPGSSGTDFACNEVEKNSKNAQQWKVVNGKGSWGTLSDPKDLPLTNKKPPTVGVRHVNISLEAELAKDSSVSKNLDVSIKVRNNYVYE